MHHKRKKPKNSRSGCLMCKANKINGWSKHTQMGHCGFGKIRDYIHSQQDLGEKYEKVLNDNLWDLYEE